MDKVFEQLCEGCRSYISIVGSVTGLDENKETMLHFTVRLMKHDNCLEALLQAGADVNCADDSCFSALLRAASEGYVHGVERLIQAGADVNRRSKDNKTALIAAAHEGHDECVELLLDAGADVNALTSGRYKHVTALHGAVDSKTVEIETGGNRKAGFEGPDRCIELLLNAGADVNALTDGPCEHVTVLHSAVGSKNITRIKLLIKAGADVNKEGYESSHEHKGVTALCLAAADGLDEAVKVLIEAGADVNRVSKNGMTALMETLQHYQGDTSKRENCIKFLLEAGADVNTEWSDYTALQWALDHGFHEAVNLLIRAGADVNKVFKDRSTAIVAASSVWDQPVNNIMKCLELLIQAGGDVNMSTPDGTALTAAAGNGFDAGVQLLIQSGADVNKVCPENDKMPLMIATANGFPQTTELLIKEGADVNLVNFDGYTALMAVSFKRPFNFRNECWMNCFRCAKLILRSGARINNRDFRLVNTSQHLIADYCGTKSNDICRLLFAAGETLDGVPDEKIPDCLKFRDVQLELKHICREAIRKHLLSVDPHTHLFGRVPRLGLPSLLTDYLLYDLSLDDIDDTSCGQ